MAITASMVKELREMTGAGMMKLLTRQQTAMRQTWMLSWQRHGQLIRARL